MLFFFLFCEMLKQVQDGFTHVTSKYNSWITYQTIISLQLTIIFITDSSLDYFWMNRLVLSNITISTFTCLCLSNQQSKTPSL